MDYKNNQNGQVIPDSEVFDPPMNVDDIGKLDVDVDALHDRPGLEGMAPDALYDMNVNEAIMDMEPVPPEPGAYDYAPDRLGEFAPIEHDMSADERGILDVDVDLEHDRPGLEGIDLDTMDDMNLNDALIESESPDETGDVDEFADELDDIQDILGEMTGEKSEGDAEQVLATAPVEELPEEPDTYDAYVVNKIKRNASFWVRLLAILLIAACAGLGYMLYEKCKLGASEPVAPASVSAQEQPVTVTPAPAPESAPVVSVESESVAAEPEKPADPTAPYFAPLDINEAKKTPDTLVVLPNLEPIQAPWWSSGMACVQMVLNYWNSNAGDYIALAKLVPDHNLLHPGVCLDQIVEAFKAVGGFEIESTRDYADKKEVIDLAFLKQHIRDGIPVIVGWTGGGAQWQVLIGYDDMNTGDEGDDILIMANPFDTMPTLNEGLGIYEARTFIENFKFYDFHSEQNSVRERCFVAVKPN